MITKHFLNYNFLVLLFFLPLTFLFHQCKTVEHEPGTYEGAMICFGEGGGFTGKVQSYCLLDNGKLFEEESLDKSYQFIKSVDKDDVEQVFDTWKLLNFQEIHINAPGNVYYYIHKKHGMRDHKVQWGSNDLQAPVELVVYHNNLMYLTRNDKK